MKALLTAEVSSRAKELEDYLDVIYAGWYSEQVILAEEQMISLVSENEVDIIITSYDPITRKVIDSSSKLKLIVCTRANPVNVDTDYAKEKGILVSYAPGRNSDCTAEYTVAMILAITRKIPQAYAALKQGIHTKPLSVDNSERTIDGLRKDVTWALGKDTPYVLYKGFQLRNKTLGVVGYGSIGRKVADICRAFGMKIISYDPYYPDKSEEDVFFVDTLTHLAEQADVITIHAKDTPETLHMIDKSVFSSMKKTAYFVNTSRGALIDEEALIEALLNNNIAGAALDVYDSEPISIDHPFITQCDNVVITPHIAGATYDAIENHTVQLLTDVKHFLRNEPLEFHYKSDSLEIN